MTMLYNRHSDSELERAVYIDPANAAARAEMLARLPALIEGAANGDELEGVKMELAEREVEVENLREEVTGLEQDVSAGDKVIDAQQSELDTAHARIAALTDCSALV
jgi:predicted  nucleic acid-binding Zn-ribbon protein